MSLLNRYVATVGLLSSPKRAWQPSSLVSAAWSAVEEAALILVVVDATSTRNRISPDVEAVIEGVMKRRGGRSNGEHVAVSLVLNKVDLVWLFAVLNL